MKKNIWNDEKIKQFREILNGEREATNAEKKHSNERLARSQFLQFFGLPLDADELDVLQSFLNCHYGTVFSVCSWDKNAAPFRDFQIIRAFSSNPDIVDNDVKIVRFEGLYSLAVGIIRKELARGRVVMIEADPAHNPEEEMK